MKKIFFGFTLSLLLYACSSDDGLLSPQHEVDAPCPSIHVSMKEAAEQLSQLLPTLTFKTRSASPGIIGQGIALGKEQQPLTRSEEDVWFYYFPINGGEQFAIMSAHKDLPALLAIGNDRPNWEVPSASVPNPMRWNISASVRAAEERNQTIADSIRATIGDSGTITDEVTIVRGTPYLVYSAGVEPTDLCPVKWGQDDPYNRLLPMNPHHPAYHSKTCCVATAVAQLFANEKMRPSTYNGYTYDWNLLANCPDSLSIAQNPTATEQICHLMKDLGVPNNLNVDYTTYEWTTTALPGNVTRTLKNFNVYNPGQYMTYSTNLVIEDLKRGYPVIMGGWSETSPVGHSWIVHGMITMCTPIYVYVGEEMYDSFEEYEYYFDMNWGWNSVGDGYYLETGLNPSRAADFNPHNYPLNGKGWGGTDLNHSKVIQYGVRMTANE